ncbi:MAG: alpha/beta fold hydrolase [Ignavibacteriales bacterium]|nr:alpha/beta fold hydrolase [Ignavibacteriales bacterium]
MKKNNHNGYSVFYRIGFWAGALLVGGLTYRIAAKRGMRRATDRADRDPDTGVLRGAHDRVYPLASDRAAILLHGFGSSPADFGDLGERLNRAGFHVVAPLMPGHGVEPTELLTVKRDEWIAVAERTHRALAERFGEVSVVGYSMGGVLALHLASTVPVQAIALWGLYVRVTHKWYYGLRPEWWTYLLAPLLGFVGRSKEHTHINDKSQLDRLVAYGYLPLRAAKELFKMGDEVRKRVRNVATPILLVHSKGDETASVKSAIQLLRKLENAERKVALLEKSNHVIGWDYERDVAATMTVDFLSSKAGAAKSDKKEEAMR